MIRLRELELIGRGVLIRECSIKKVGGSGVEARVKIVTKAVKSL